MRFCSALLLALACLPAAGFAFVADSDPETLNANIGMIQECLGQHKGAERESCIGITKAFCHLDEPTCNREEAAAWDELAFRQRPSLRKSQAAWLRRTEASCAYRNKDTGYKDVLPHNAWDDNLAPSGCVLQHSARRAMGLHGKKKR